MVGVFSPSLRHDMKQPRERLHQMCGNPACNPAKRATALVKIIDDKYIFEESNKLQAYRASAKAVKWNENESVVGLHRTSWNPLDTRRINRSTCTGCPRCAHTQVLSAARSKVDCLRHRGMQHTGVCRIGCNSLMVGWNSLMVGCTSLVDKTHVNIFVVSRSTNRVFCP